MPKKQEKRGGRANPVYVRFGKAKQTPSQRHTKKPPHSAQLVMRMPEPKSDLHRYVTENEESGLTYSELIEQFQEYDCDHKQWEEVSWTRAYTEFRCTRCLKRSRKQRPDGG